MRAAFAMGTRIVWRVMVGVACLGFLSCFLMREEPMVQDSLEMKKGEEDAESVELEKVKRSHETA